MPRITPLPPSRASTPMDLTRPASPTSPPIDPWKGLDPELGGPLTEEWKQQLADNPPSQAITRPGSPSQIDSPAKRRRTSLSSYSYQSTPLTQSFMEPPGAPPHHYPPITDPPPDPEIDRVDFIRSMNTWDNPTIVQPEDIALLLYLGHTPF